MRIKLDENMPTALVEALEATGCEVETVVQEGLRGHPDAEVWSEAQQAARFLITQDLDFADIRRFRPGTHHGILLVRLAEPSRRRLIARIHDIFGSEDVRSWHGCFVIATERKIRVRRPGKTDQQSGR